MKGKNKKNKYASDYEDDFTIFGGSPSSYQSNFFEESYQSHQEKLLKPPPLRPRNETQRKYLEMLEDKDISILIATGPAGTGKTMLPAHVAIQKLLNGDIKKVIITRPAVSVEEQHGFLPGTLEEKMEPWLRPVFDVFYQYYTPQKIQKLIQTQIIEICPLAYMRGRTFEESFIIADESQNMTPNQMLMLLTRIGRDSKMIITGDDKQHDRGFENNGLKDFMTRLENIDHSEIKHVQFTYRDVERHRVIPKILKLYEHH